MFHPAHVNNVDGVLYIFFDLLGGVLKIRGTKSELFLHGRRKKHVAWALKNITEGIGNLSHTDLVGIFAFHQYPPTFRFEQANGVFYQGGLAGTIRPKNSNHVAAVDRNVDVVQNYPIRFIPERDIFKLDQRLCVYCFWAQGRVLTQFCQARRGRIFGCTFHNHSSWQFDLMIINGTVEATGRAIILNFAFHHKNSILRRDAQNVFNTMFHHQYCHAFIRQVANDVKGFLCGGGVE